MIKEYSESALLEKLLSEIAQAYDLNQFLKKTIIFGKDFLKCSGASVFLYDYSTGMLEMQETTYAFYGELSLAPQQGLAGEVFRSKTPRISGEKEIKSDFQPLGPFSPDNFELMIEIPVLFNGTPIAVFSFDVFKETADHRELNADRKGQSVENIIHESSQIITALMSPQFGNALERVQHTEVEKQITRASFEPIILWQTLADILSRIQQNFLDSVYQKNLDLLYVALIDRDSNTIRAMQGFGYPLMFLSKAHHRLSTNDIQSIVPKESAIYIINGFKSGGLLDESLYTEYDHDQFIRIWIPLFPFPFKSLVYNRNKSIESVIKHALKWEQEKGVGYILRHAAWNKDITDSGQLIYGTLELGFKRKNMNEIELEDFEDEDFCHFCVSSIINLSNELYEATLDGALNTIGRKTAQLAKADSTRFFFRMPGTGECFQRVYPQSREFASAKKIDTDPEEPIGFEFLDAALCTDSNLLEYRAKLIIDAIKSVKQAFRLHRLEIRASRIIDPVDDPKDYGTLVHDKLLLHFCDSAARDAQTDFCAIYLYELKNAPSSGEKNKLAEDKRLLGEALISERGKEEMITKDQNLSGIAEKTFKNKTPVYECIDYRSRVYQVAAIPLQIHKRAIAVLIFGNRKNHPFTFREQRKLESNVTRWTIILSGIVLLRIERFSDLMKQIRHDVTIIRQNIEDKFEELECDPMDLFMTQFLQQLSIVTGIKLGVLTIFSKSPPSDISLLRYWLIKKENEIIVNKHRFPDIEVPNPCKTANATGQIGQKFLSIGNQDENLDTFLSKLMLEIDRCRKSGNDHEVQILTEFYTLLREQSQSTVLTTPIYMLEQWSQDSDEQISLTIFLKGLHCFSKIKENLILEGGNIFAHSLKKIRSLDKDRSIRHHQARLQERSKLFYQQENIDAVFGVLLASMGQHPSRKYPSLNPWRIGDHCIIWRLASNGQELILRGCSESMSREDFQRLSMIKYRKNHPLLIKLLKSEVINWPGKDLPRQDEKSRLESFDLQSESEIDSISTLYKNTFETQSIRWLISVPLVDIQGNVWGIMDLLRKIPLTRQENTLLPDILHQVSIRLTDAVKQKRQDLQNRIDREMSIVSAECLHRFSPLSLYDAISRIMKATMSCDICDLFVKRHGRMILQSSTRDIMRNIGYIDRLHYGFIEQPETSLNEDFLNLSLRTGKPIIVRRTQQLRFPDEISRKLKQLLLDDDNVQRLICPLVLKRNDRDKELWGIICLTRKSDRIETSPREFYRSTEFNEEDRQTIQAICHPIRRTVQMAGLSEQQIWLVREMNHSLRNLSQKTYDPPVRLLEKLYISNCWDSECAALKSNLEIAFSMLNQTAAQLNFLASEESQEIISQSFSALNLYHFIKTRCDYVDKSQKHDAESIKFYGDLMQLKNIPVHADWLGKAFEMILENACKYSYIGETVIVKAWKESDNIIVTITNWGIGIPERDLERIFELYFRSMVPDKFHERRGTGIGLFIARRAIQDIHRGQITCTSKPVVGKTRGSEAEDLEGIKHETTFKIILNIPELKSILVKSQIKMEDSYE